MRIFLDHLPGHDDAELRAATRAGGTLARDRGAGWVVVGSPREIREAPEGASLWLRGVEACGAGGEFGAVTLIRAAARTGRPWVVEGVGLGASAAALAVGADGVVLDVATWTTRGSPLDPASREALLRARGGRDTEIVAGRRQLRGHPLDAPQSVAEARRGDGLDLGELVARTRAELTDRLARIAASHPLRPGLDPLGCGRPVVQGPMANVTERAGLAVAVSAAGGLPFCALGALDPDRACEVLAAFDAALRGRRWGAGVIGFDVMPHRDAHLDAIVALGDRAPTVILAGGTAATARALAERGVEVWLHTPSATLARQALERGVTGVVFEGREAGGHVGALTAAGLWEEGLSAVAARPDGAVTLLAGGIGDAVSAAFAAAMAADAAAAGARVALQAGTAFLATHEIVEAGQLAPLYQQVALSCDHTVLVGDSVGLPLRCAPNAFTREALAAEAAWRAEGLTVAERRLRMEHHNLGRTRMAARGIERNPTWPAQGQRYRSVAAARQLAEGAYSVGEGAALADRASPVREVVDALSTDAAAWLGRVAGATPIPPAALWPAATGVPGEPRAHALATPTSVRLGAQPRAPGSGAVPIAIVGLGCVLPGAPDVARFWANLVEGVDAIGPIPDARWPAWRYWDPAAGTSGPVRSVSRRAGVVGSVGLDPAQFRIPPRALATVDPAQRLALLASDQAVRDAGWDRPGFDRGRAAVILGNAMGGEHAKSLALRIRFHEVLAALEAEGGLDGLEPAQRDALYARVEARLDAALPPVEVDSMAGLLGNVVAGRVAGWLDWMGGSFTVDAACAASLASLAVAVDWLRNHRCDAVLAGGVDADLSPETFAGFTRTLALSAEGSTPFSSRADGFVMGEGAAVFALRRLPDALAAGEPVWAVIRAVGQASDGRGRSLTAPRAEGQRLAVRRAWSEAGAEPDAFELIEAHGTGTAVGDATEVGVLAAMLGDGDTVWLGSVKASIGHLKGGAGAAGLLKATLALATGVAPPTLNAAPVAPIPGLTGGRLRLPRRPVGLRGGLAGVSAFGFGGTDFHAVLAPPEAAHPDAAALRAMAEPLVAAPSEAGWHDTPPPPVLLAYGGADPAALLAAVRDDQPTTPALAAAAPHRCAVLVDPDTRPETLDRVTRWLEAGAPTGRLGRVAFAGAGPAEPVVVLVPGQGARPGRARHAIERIPAAARALAAVDAPPVGDPDALDPLSVHRALVPVAIGWTGLLAAAQLPIAATLGHSLGELGALVAAGRLDPREALALAEARGEALAACPEGAMLAVALPVDAAGALAQRVGATVAAHNAPDRCVLAGDAASIERAEVEARATGIPARRLAVTRAYHAAPTAPAAEALRPRLDGQRFVEGLPCWSGASAAPMTHPGDDLRRGLGSPVRFADAVAGLLAAGHRTFVELGPGDALTASVRAIAPDATAIALDPEPGDHGVGLAAAAAASLAAGHPGLVGCLPATCVTVGLPAASPAPPRRPRDPGAALSATPPAALAAQADAPNARLDVTPEPADTTTAPEDPVVAAVLDAVCDVTGYPRTFVDGAAELEAELGVDSIRKLEILGRIEDRLGFRATEADHRLLERASVDRLVAFARERVAAPAAVVRSRPVGDVSLWTRVPTAPSPATTPVEPGLSADATAWSLSPPPAGAAVAARVRAAVEQVVDRARTGPRPTRLVVRGGPDDPVTGALLGLARSLGREWEVPVDAPPAAAWHRHRPDPSEPPRRPAIWVTGGVGGILGPILAACADLDPAVTVLGRTAHDDAIARLRTLGLTLDHLACDLGDGDAVDGVVADRVASHGPPDLVLHAAAATADGPVGSVTTEALDRVLGPKVDGLAHLAAALPGSTRWLLLSSVAALEGNAGQALYAAANGALHAWPLAHATTVASTAWRGPGLASSPLVQRELERRGVVPVEPEAAAAAMRDLVVARLADRAPREVLLVGQDPPSARPLPWPLHALADVGPDRLVARILVTPAQPELRDHRVAGRALVPAALWIRAIQRAHALVAPEAVAVRLTEFHLALPTRVDDVRDDLFVDLTRAGRRWAVTLRAGGAVVGGAFAATAVLPKGRKVAPAPLVGSPAPYRADALFHGPRWQVIDRWTVDGDRASADLLVAADPVADLVDGAHQLLALWAHARLGVYALPVGAASWNLVDAPAGPIRLELRAALTDHGVTGEFTASAADGQPLASASGVRSEPIVATASSADV